jgi:hypothetical protein
MSLIVCPSRGTSAALDLGTQRVESLVPETPIAVEPHVDLLQRLRIGGIEAASTLGSDGGEAVLPEHPQVLRHPGLGDAEFLLDGRGDGARGLLTVGEQETVASDR